MRWYLRMTSGNVNQHARVTAAAGCPGTVSTLVAGTPAFILAFSTPSNVLGTNTG